MFRGLVTFAFSIFWGVSAHALLCANGYVDTGAACMPVLTNDPTSEFHRDADGYPVCGAGRVALSGDGSYAWSSYSSSGKPRWNGAPYTYNSNSYSYTMSTVPNPPIYGFPPDSRCYCLGKNLSNTVNEGANQTSTYSIFPSALTSGGQRQYPVTFDVITSQTNDETVKYGPVPLAKDPSKDGRIDALIAGMAAATCGCPNVNEEPTSNGADTLHADAVGSYCKSMVSSANPVNFTQNARVLTSFDQIKHATQVMSSGWEQLDAGGQPVSTVLLPSAASAQDSTVSYKRKIWTCAAPFELNTGSRTCEFIQAHHACDNGAGGGPASPVNADTIGATDGLKFDNIINRKLACCLNAFQTGGTENYEKFDCAANAGVAYTSFDDLWSKTDANADGGQPNAILLSDSTKFVGAVKVPRIISGFYSITGQHCDQFSEFAYTGGSSITHYRVDPVVKSGQQTSVGAAPVAFGVDIPVPNSASYSQIQAGVTGTLGKTVPSTAADYRACPILVRAAIVTSCPPSTLVPNALTTVTPVTAGSVPHCAVAGGIQIHVKIEQIYEITGTAPIKPVDTYLELNTTTSIDVTKLIADKIGDQCPPQTTKVGDRCVY